MRLFIALNIPSDIGSTIERYQKELSLKLPGVKWIPPKNLHITLKFLGEIEEGRLAAIKGAVKLAASEIKDFRMVFAGTGVFPNMIRPRVFWVGVTSGQEVLVEAAKKLETALEEQGFLPELREFRTHVTIGRFKENRTHPEIMFRMDKNVFTDREFGTFDATYIAVIQSTLTSGGPIYSVLEKIPFGSQNT